MAAQVSTKRQGAAGTYIPAGIITGVEANRKLQHTGGRGTPTEPGDYDLMRKQDPRAGSLLRAIKAPLLAAPQDIVPPAEADDREQAATDFIVRAFEGLAGGRRGWLRDILTAADFGFALLEEVYRRASDGMLTWRTLAPLHQTTVEGWWLADDDLAEVQFRTPVDGTDWRTLRIKAQHLTLLSVDREGNNFEGVSLLRSAYTPWLIKRQALRQTAIDVERGSGFMKWRKTQQQSAWSDTDKEACEEASINWRTNEDSFVLLPGSIDLDIVFPKIPIADRVELVRLCNQEIVSSFMASFLELGLGPTGTQALSRDLRSNFVGALRWLADLIEDTMNAPGGATVSGAIQRLVDVNFGPMEPGRYPRLRIGTISTRDVDDAIDTMVKGKQGGLFDEGPGWSVDDANTARDMVDLDPTSDEDDGAGGDEAVRVEEPLAGKIGVGGIQAISDLVVSVAAGTMPRDAALSMLVSVFGMAPKAADEMLPGEGEDPGAALPGSDPDPSTNPTPEPEPEEDIPDEEPTGDGDDLPPEEQQLARRIRPGSETAVVDGEGVAVVVHRQLTEAEFCLALAKIERLFEQADAGLEGATRPVLERAAAAMAADVRSAVFAEGLDAADRLALVNDLSLRTSDRLALQEAIRSHLADVAAEASDEVKREVGRQVARGGLLTQEAAAAAGHVALPLDTVPAANLAATSEAQAALTARKMADELEGSIRDAGARASMLGPEGAAEAVADADAAATARASSWFRRHAAAPVSAVVQQGRERGAQEAFEAAGVEGVAFVQFSSLLDGNTCSPCAAEDGKEFPYGSAEYFRLRPPFQGCDGRSRCRCIFVYVGSRETPTQA